MAAAKEGHGTAVTFLLGHPSSHAVIGDMMGTDGLSRTTALGYAAVCGHVDCEI